MYAGLSVLQQAAEYGYSSTVYAPQPRDAQLRMPAWAWFLVTTAVLSISVAGEFWAHSPLTTVHAHETIRAHTAQAATCMVLFLCLLIQIRLPQCSPQHQVLTHLSGSQYKPPPRPDRGPVSAGIFVAAWYHLHRSEPFPSVSQPVALAHVPINCLRDMVFFFSRQASVLELQEPWSGGIA